MPNIRIGAGHTTPPADYLTAQLAWDALSGSDQGGEVVGLCKGDCGQLFNPTGASVNPWSLKTEDVIYDFTTATRSQLALLNRPNLAAKINISHMRISSNHAFSNAIVFGVGSQGSICEFLSINHPNANGVDSVEVLINTSSPVSILRNCDVDGGLNGFDYNFNRKLIVNNVIQFGASADGFQGAGTNDNVTDTFAFNNGNNDYVAVPTVFCASEDLTGDLTGFTSSELVDFAGGDYRTKSTSALATAGSGGSFIGCALETSSGIAITGDITLPSLVFSGSATDSTSEVTANGDITLPSLVFSGSATDSTSEVTANGSVTLPSLVFAGSATDSTSEVTANGAIALPSLVFSGSAGVGVTGNTANGSVTLPSLVFAGSATDSTSEVTANGSVTLPSLVFAGSATDSTPGVTANGSVTLPSLVFAGSATDSTSEVTANGDITLPSLVFAGSITVGEVFTDFTIIIDVSIKTIQTTLNEFTIEV